MHPNWSEITDTCSAYIHLNRSTVRIQTDIPPFHACFQLFTLFLTIAACDIYC